MGSEIRIKRIGSCIRSLVFEEIKYAPVMICIVLAGISTMRMKIKVAYRYRSMLVTLASNVKAPGRWTIPAKWIYLSQYHHYTYGTPLFMDRTFQVP
jgi:hypothetical protein